jgi:hypothetical protein
MWYNIFMKNTKVSYPRYYRKGQTYKLTAAEIKEIKSLRKQKKTAAFIAKKFKISETTVLYHTNPRVNARVKDAALNSYYSGSKKEHAAKQREHIKDKISRMKKQMREFWRSRTKKN